MTTENFFTKVMKVTVSIDKLDTAMIDGSTYAVYIIGYVGDEVSIIASWYGGYDEMREKYESIKGKVL